jgi:mycofactocin glycosyltransferase
VLDSGCELSVVIPCRLEPIVTQTIDRVLSVARDEGVRGIEVIVVGSGDWRKLPDDPAVRVVETDRPLWSGPARNRGLAIARGDALAFLDADCVPLPGWFTGIAASLKRGPVIGSGAIVTPGDDFWQDCYNLACFREFLVGNAESERTFLPTFCLWGPRQAFVDVGGFDESWAGAEDLDLTARLAQAGWPLRFDPAVCVRHCPQSRSFARIIRHGWAHGGTSIRARRLHPEAFGTRPWRMSPVALVALGPAVALYLLGRTYLDQPGLRSVCLRGGLAIYLFRLAWCFGAAWSQLRPRRTFEPVANQS